MATLEVRACKAASPQRRLEASEAAQLRRILELEDPLPAERAGDGVVERAEVLARDVRLVVARVEVIGDVEHLQPDRRVVAEENELLRDLRVERDERRIAAGRVARADEVAVGVDVREREAASRIENGKNGAAARQRHARPHEHATGRAPRPRAALAGPNHPALEVAEEP